MKKIVLTGGGTAGHVTPNIALVPKLKESGFEIKYIGTYNGMEKQLVEYARSVEKQHGKNFRFTVTTNGVLLNDDIKQYINENMSNVVLSIDGTKETNDRMRYRVDGSGSYDTIVPKFQDLAESRNQNNYYVRGTLLTLSCLLSILILLKM